MANRNRIKRTKGDVVLDVIIYILLTLLALICLYPLYQVVVVSFSDPSIVQRKNGMLLAIEGFQTDAYKMVFSNKNIATGFKNSIFYILVGTVLQLATTVTAAYVLSKKNAMLKKPIMIYFSITMYFSGGLIPTFLLINQLGLMNTCWAILLPGACSVWDIIIMRTQFVSVPEGLKEAATIDGATRFQRVLHVDIPAILPTIIIMLIMNAGSMLNVGFEKIYLMQTDMNLRVSEVISTFVYKRGLGSGGNSDYAFSTAVGLFNNVINLILLVTVNRIAARVSETSLW